MTPQQPCVQRLDRMDAVDESMHAADRQRKLQRNLGGGDLRDRKSTTLVVAWMSPQFFFLVGACDELSDRERVLGWDALSLPGGG